MVVVVFFFFFGVGGHAEAETTGEWEWRKRWLCLSVPEGQMQDPGVSAERSTGSVDEPQRKQEGKKQL